MRVNITDEIRQQHPELIPAIHESSSLLEDELGASADRVRADWSFSTDDSGPAPINLTVSDWTGSVGYRFAPDELSNHAHMQIRLHRLWGDLLSVRSHHQLDEYRWQLQGQPEH